jgi:hypothetical protein
MAITNGTCVGVTTSTSRSVSAMQTARVFLTHDSTNNYDTSAHGKLLGVGALISASRRNGMTVTLRGVSSVSTQDASKASDGTLLQLGTVAISSADITYNVLQSDRSTEITNGAPCAAQNDPFAIDVMFTEA